MGLTIHWCQQMWSPDFVGYVKRMPTASNLRLKAIAPTGARFSKVPVTFRARKAIYETTFRLFS